MKKYLVIILLLALAYPATAQNKISGIVISAADSTALPGASIRIKGSMISTMADQNGEFSIGLDRDEAILLVSFMGYHTMELPVKRGSTALLKIALEENRAQLQEVVVSTGYQNLPKERATGSFVQVDNNLLNRRVSTGIMDRIEDVVPGLVFRRGPYSNGGLDINIRGRSTLFANEQPLIVLDNFPYEGDLESINPNDVESITVLRDAAAASIWGDKASNGVIVITSKKGRLRRAPEIAFNSNVTISSKPDLFYEPKMSASDFIDMEQYLFGKGFYSSTERSANRKTPLSPVVELLIAQRDGKISSTETAAQLAVLKGNDTRRELDQYLNRNRMNSQYALSMKGGAENQHYYISAGYDHNLAEQRGNSFSRISLNGNSTWSLLQRKLEFTSMINFSQAISALFQPAIESYPYLRFQDEQGNPMAVINNVRQSLITEAGQKGLLDWAYRPLDELALADHKRINKNYRFNSSLKYRLAPGLHVSALYQYAGGNMEDRNLRNQDSFYTRDLINSLSKIETDGSVSRPVPLGGIMDIGNASFNSNSLRMQLNLDRSWKEHQLTAIAGSEIRDRHTTGSDYRLYGYDAEHASSIPVDYISAFPLYYRSGSTNKISNMDQLENLTDRYLSYYSNAAYTYRDKYTFSASGRLDQSNLFGAETNQRGVPLYSVGLAWNTYKEDFYASGLLPYLRIRASYGYNGNIDKSLSALTTAVYNNGAGTVTRQPFARVDNPPNPELRWERVRIINLGFDFNSRNNILGGSLEFFSKRGIDLIGSRPFAPSTGISTFKGNVAQTSGKGFDLNLNSRNIDRNFKWFTNFLFTYAADKVRSYDIAPNPTLLAQGYILPLSGKPLNSIFSYAWAGLNPVNGDPLGYLDGQASNDYVRMRAAATLENIIYHGPALPPIYGALRNNFSFKAFSVSAGISYRFGYYVRNSSVNYSSVLRGLGGHADYALRWQNPGDESFTQVPSVPVAANANRDNFYLYSSALVKKGDHIRLQDINLSYDLRIGRTGKMPFRSMQLYLYANNLGILWKAEKGNIDPEYPLMLPLKTVAAGLKMGF
ncbi:MAG: SusC/RagA family TonB-linked outer membrane protein [Pedobacter sp.]|nr:SusC/RagA family TonB-linked outer membrane protein [Pedobacter sp.]